MVPFLTPKKILVGEIISLFDSGLEKRNFHILPIISSSVYFALSVLRTAGLRVGQFIDGIVVDVSSRVVGAPITLKQLAS